MVVFILWETEERRKVMTEEIENQHVKCQTKIKCYKVSKLFFFLI